MLYNYKAVQQLIHLTIPGQIRTVLYIYVGHVYKKTSRFG